MPPSGDRNRYRKIWRDGECKIENRLGTTTTGNNNNKPEKTVHNMLSPSLVSLKWSNNNNNSNCTDGVQLLWSPHRYGERTTRERESESSCAMPADQCCCYCCCLAWPSFSCYYCFLVVTSDNKPKSKQVLSNNNNRKKKNCIKAEIYGFLIKV